MRLLITTLAALPVALAHYNFDSLVVNGVVTAPYKYVRSVKNTNYPVLNLSTPEIVCGAGGLDADVRAKTATYKVAPGDQLGFTITPYVTHPGPAAIYLGRAPSGTSAQEYLGDGAWWKAYQTTVRRWNENGGSTDWTMYPGGSGPGPYYNANNFTFTLPADTPSGQYLLRGEHVALHAAAIPDGAQVHTACAQIEVTGSGKGKPAPLVKFPGAYGPTSPGMVVNLFWPGLKSYTPPGPLTWPGACIDHTLNFAGQASDGDCTPMQ